MYMYMYTCSVYYIYMNMYMCTYTCIHIIQTSLQNNDGIPFNRFMLDHATSNLIWNYKTREELREALENEIRSFTVDKDLSGTTNISWNHVEFEVRYESLSEEIKIGDYYLRLLLDEGGSTNFVKPLVMK